MPAAARLPAYTTRLPPGTWLAWRPGLDTWVALASVGAMWLVHFAAQLIDPLNPTVAESLLLFLGAILLATLLPVWLVWHRMRRDLDDLGFTLRRVWLAVGLGAVIGLGSLPPFWNAAATLGIDPVSQTWAQLLVVWEPLFVYGWLQLRLRDGFGELPAPLLAALCYGLYHLGTEPIPDTLFRVAFGLVFAIAFALTRNLLVLVPIGWGLATGLMGIAAGEAYGIDTIALRVVVVLLQAAIVIMAYRRHPGDLDSRPARTTPDDRGAAELRARADRARHRTDRTGDQ